MTPARITPDQIDRLQARFGDRLQRNVPLARYTSLRVGGPARCLMTARNRAELEEYTRFIWKEGIPFLMIGGGSNILISETGVKKLVVLNRAKKIEFRDPDENGPQIYAESGASLGLVARRAASRGWSGLEWGAGIPGTIGGAVVGNAGAHGGDTAGSLKVAEILHKEGQKVEVGNWTPANLEYQYRSSRLKRDNLPAVVLSAKFQLSRSTPEAVKATLEKYSEYRQQTQPGGASVGSMFKNPPGHYAGELIDRAGLKGTRIGGAEISSLHGNFFLNHGEATADDIFGLLRIARQEVAEQFDIDLQLEITLEGDWSEVE